jgi:hypothetical protein
MKISHAWQGPWSRNLRAIDQHSVARDGFYRLEYTGPNGILNIPA